MNYITKFAATTFRATAFVISMTLAVHAQEIRISYETSDTHLKARTVSVFKAELEKMTGNKLKVSTFPNSSLIPSKQEVTSTIRGQVDAIVPFISYFESITPKAKLLTTPLVFTGYDHLTRAMEGKVGAAIYGDLEAKGLKPLGFWRETPTLMFTSKKRIGSLEDLSDLKIRTYPSATLQSMLTALGTNATVIPGNEVYLALQNGTVDGAVTTPSFAVSMKLDEVLKYAVDVKLVLGGYIFAMNKEYFEKLSPDMQQSVILSAQVATEWNKKQIGPEIEKSVKQAAQNGLELVKVSNAEAAKWQAAMNVVYENMDPEVKALIDIAKTYK
jgi:C4-dicarboxylate-binding protein DctP